MQALDLIVAFLQKKKMALTFLWHNNPLKPQGVWASSALPWFIVNLDANSNRENTHK